MVNGSESNKLKHSGLLRAFISVDKNALRILPLPLLTTASIMVNKKLNIQTIRQFASLLFPKRKTQFLWKISTLVNGRLLRRKLRVIFRQLPTTLPKILAQI